jgi:LDH2 family malate/lactate/ureidoglycolate dehydrogenase
MPTFSLTALLTVAQTILEAAGAPPDLALMKTTPTAEGFSEVLVPGEPEWRARRERLAAGISLPEPTWQDIQALARGLNVTL